VVTSRHPTIMQGTCRKRVPSVMRYSQGTEIELYKQIKSTALKVF